MKRLALIALVVAAACGGGRTMNTFADSGIEGTVTIGPQCPVERADSPCPDRPLAAEIRFVERVSGRVVTTARSGSDGRFRVSLPPGAYTLEPVSPSSSGIPFGKPVEATVRAHAYTTVDVSFDSGIR